MSVILDIVFGIILLYLSFSVIYLFILSVFGKLFYKTNKFLHSAALKKIAILVPAYKEDGIIVHTAEELLLQNYPRNLFDIYIIADSFERETLQKLRQLPVEVIEVSFEKSTKAKALNKCFAAINKEYDIAIISDADNILAKNFLQKMSDAFAGNKKIVVQGRRVAKNMDTPYAVLDACSEAINNHLFRKGNSAIGLSSALIGSGMAFHYQFAKEIMKEIEAVGGYDRILQLKIVERKVKIEYLEDALIFDEKIDSLPAFHQQRKRWLHSHFAFAKGFFLSGIKQLAKGNFSYFNLAIASTLIPPRIYLLALLMVLPLLSYLAGGPWYLAFAGLFFMYFVTLILAFPRYLVNQNLLKAILRLPTVIAAMSATNLKMKGAGKSFIHTVHTKKGVSNPLYYKNK